MNDDGKCKLCVLMSLPCITQYHFVGMLVELRLSSKKNRPHYCLFPFRMETVLPLRTASWIADILSQASLRDVQRQRCWKRGSGDGQRRWDYDTTERSFNAISALCVAVERRASTLTVCKAIGGSRWRGAANLYDMPQFFAESVGLCLCFLPSCAMYKDNAVGNVVAEMGRDLVSMTTARLSDLSMPLKGGV